MIVRRVSAALLLRDGYTGVPLSSGAEVLAWLDGRPARPVRKAGGYLVLTDLPPGKHALRLRHRCFQEEELELDIRDGLCREAEIDFTPGPRYPFREEPARLELVVSRAGGPLADETVWLGRPGAVRLKLARDETAARENAVRLFCGGSSELLPVPGWFLVEDAAKPETVHLRALNGDFGTLDRPLSAGHARGTSLLPARRGVTNREGTLRALFREPGTLRLLCLGRFRRAELKPGEQTLRWQLDEEGDHG